VNNGKFDFDKKKNTDPMILSIYNLSV